MMPGWMMLQRTFWRANWIAIDFVSAMSAPLALVYESCATVKPASADTEPTLMIEPPPEHQVGDAVLHHEERPLQVDRLHAVPVGLLGVEDRLVLVLPEDAGVVVEDVEPAEALHAGGDHALHVGLLRDVAHHPERLPAPALDHRDRLLGRLGVDVGDDHRCALLREEQRPLAPLPHPRPGDERDLPFQPH